VLRALRYLVQSADHAVEPRATMSYRIESQAGSHLVYEEGDELARLSGPDAVVDLVYRRVHQRAFELAALGGWVRLHAAVVDHPSARTVIVGPSGIGKTTLSCRLLLDGVAVAADESTLVRDGATLPVARRFHLKPGAEDAVPDLGLVARDLPAFRSVRAFDPAEAGYRWHIAERAVDHVVLLSRAEGPATLSPASAIEAMPEVVAESFHHQEPVGVLLRELAALMRLARCWRVVAGPVADAARLVRSLPER
jgi:hypothetical protein